MPCDVLFASSLAESASLLVEHCASHIGCSNQFTRLCLNWYGPARYYTNNTLSVEHCANHFGVSYRIACVCVCASLSHWKGSITQHSSSTCDDAGRTLTGKHHAESAHPEQGQHASRTLSEHLLSTTWGQCLQPPPEHMEHTPQEHSQHLRNASRTSPGHSRDTAETLQNTRAYQNNFATFEDHFKDANTPMARGAYQINPRI